MAKIELLQNQSKITNYLKKDERIIWYGQSVPSISIYRSNSYLASLILGCLTLFVGIILFQKTSPDETEFYFICYGLFAFSGAAIIYPFLRSYYLSRTTKYYLTNNRFFRVRGTRAVPFPLDLLSDIHVVSKNKNTGTVLAGEYGYESIKRKDGITEAYEHKAYLIVIRKLENPDELIKLIKENL